MAPPVSKDIPFGILLIKKASSLFCPSKIFNRNAWYRTSVVILTFATYTCYHMNRKPLSVVKNVLHRNCSDVQPRPNGTDDNWCDWAPFDGDDATTLLGFVDSSFLIAYAAAMFVSGFVAERVCLRRFLALGMVLSGFAGCLMGISKYANLHSEFWLIVFQIFGGFVQTSGWPGVVAVMGNWFGKGKRGFIFGVWNSHTSLGNILGTLIAANYVETDWGLSFIVPGIIMISVGIINFFFLVPHPVAVGCVVPQQNRPEPRAKSNHIPMDRLSDVGETTKMRGSKYLRKRSSVRFKTKQKKDRPIRQILKSVRNVVDLTKNAINSRYQPVPSTDEDDPEPHPGPGGAGDAVEEATLDDGDVSRSSSEGRPILHSEDEGKPIGFFGALRIPGVVEFSLCLFFAKLVSYTFLYWLPQYIKNSTTLSAKDSADLSTVFDIGGVVGGILAGIVSDFSGKNACTCAVMLIIAVPCLQVYNLYGATSIVLNVSLLIVAGLLVNGPYALITTAVSAELGTHHSLQGNGKALATVTAIIDGTGSIGAAAGPLLAGVVSQYGWKNVFYMLMVSDFFALLLLLRLVKRELMPQRSPSHHSEWQA